jgi:hypothetical protein
MVRHCRFHFPKKTIEVKYHGPKAPNFDGFVIFAALPIISIFIFYLIYFLVPTFRHYLLPTLPPHALIGLQLYRIDCGCSLTINIRNYTT